MNDTNWFEDRGVDEPPRTAGKAWMIYAALAVAMIIIPMLFGCTSPCQRSDEIVTVLATNETHVIQLRGHVEMCPR